MYEHEKHQMALTYLWGMQDALYDPETNTGDYDAAFQFGADASEFATWFSKAEDYRTGGHLRVAYNHWQRFVKGRDDIYSPAKVNGASL